MADKRLVVCVNERLGFGHKSCGGSGSRKLIKQLQRLLDQQQLDIPIVEQVCLGRCDEGIAMRIAPAGPYFTQVKKKDLGGIVEELKQFNPD